MTGYNYSILFNDPILKVELMNFSFVQITDHHITPSDAELLGGYSTRHALRTVLRHIAQDVGNRADFILSTGDLVEKPSETSYQAFLQMLNARNASSEMPGPIFISAEGFQDFPMYLFPATTMTGTIFSGACFRKASPYP